MPDRAPNTADKPCPRYVYAEKPRCPRCGAVDLRTTRTLASSEGETSRRTECRTCGWKFIVVWE